MYFYGDEFSDELSKTMNIITDKNKDTYKSMGRSFTWVNTCFFLIFMQSTSKCYVHNIYTNIRLATDVLTWNQCRLDGDIFYFPRTTRWPVFMMAKYNWRQFG